MNCIHFQDPGQLIYGFYCHCKFAYLLQLKVTVENYGFKKIFSPTCFSFEDKFYHFFSICFGLGCGMAVYRPYYPIMTPALLSVISTLVFEFVGMLSDLPAHTKRCKGPPYHRRDAFWGLCAALLVAILNLDSYHVYTLSYGCGIMVFAVRGAKRKYSSLWDIRERWWPRWQSHAVVNCRRLSRMGNGFYCAT